MPGLLLKRCTARTWTGAVSSIKDTDNFDVGRLDIYVSRWKIAEPLPTQCWLLIDSLLFNTIMEHSSWTTVTESTPVNRTFHIVALLGRAPLISSRHELGWEYKWCVPIISGRWVQWDTRSQVADAWSQTAAMMAMSEAYASFSLLRKHCAMRPFEDGRTHIILLFRSPIGSELQCNVLTSEICFSQNLSATLDRVNQ